MNTATLMISLICPFFVPFFSVTFLYRLNLKNSDFNSKTQEESLPQGIVACITQMCVILSLCPLLALNPGHIGNYCHLSSFSNGRSLY